MAFQSQSQKWTGNQVGKQFWALSSTTCTRKWPLSLWEQRGGWTTSLKDLCSYRWVQSTRNSDLTLQDWNQSKDDEWEKKQLPSDPESPCQIPMEKTAWDFQHPSYLPCSHHSCLHSCSEKGQWGPERSHSSPTKRKAENKMGKREMNPSNTHQTYPPSCSTGIKILTTGHQSVFQTHLNHIMINIRETVLVFSAGASRWNHSLSQNWR